MNDNINSTSRSQSSPDPQEHEQGDFLVTPSASRSEVDNINPSRDTVNISTLLNKQSMSNGPRSSDESSFPAENRVDQEEKRTDEATLADNPSVFSDTSRGKIDFANEMTLV